MFFIFVQIIECASSYFFILLIFHYLFFHFPVFSSNFLFFFPSLALFVSKIIVNIFAQNFLEICVLGNVCLSPGHKDSFLLKALFFFFYVCVFDLPQINFYV